MSNKKKKLRYFDIIDKKNEFFEIYFLLIKKICMFYRIFNKRIDLL